jgi:hypothetical protein
MWPWENSRLVIPLVAIPYWLIVFIGGVIAALRTQRGPLAARSRERQKLIEEPVTEDAALHRLRRAALGHTLGRGAAWLSIVVTTLGVIGGYVVNTAEPSADWADSRWGMTIVTAVALGLSLAFGLAWMHSCAPRSALRAARRAPCLHWVAVKAGHTQKSSGTADMPAQVPLLAAGDDGHRLDTGIRIAGRAPRALWLTSRPALGAWVIAVDDDRVLWPEHPVREPT